MRGKKKKQGERRYRMIGAAWKAMPLFVLWWPRTSEADLGGTAIEVEPSHQYSIIFCSHVKDGSRGAV